MAPQNSILTVAIALITAIIGPIFVEWVKNTFFKSKFVDVLGESINTDERATISFFQEIETLYITLGRK